MTEKEKCKQGLLYNPNYDKELIEERTDCKALCQEYNETKYADVKKRNALIHKIVGKAKALFLSNNPFSVITATMSNWAIIFIPTIIL